MVLTKKMTKRKTISYMENEMVSKVNVRSFDDSNKLIFKTKCIKRWYRSYAISFYIFTSLEFF